MAFVMAPEVPASSTMAVPYGPMGVGLARRRMRDELQAGGAPDSIVDDAMLILSELLSNSCRHASPLPPDDSVRADWAHTADGRLTISVTDGGGPTRPLPATPSVTAHGGRGLSIITSLARDWGVEDRGDQGGVTVWAVIGPPQGISPDARLGSCGLTSMRGLAGPGRLGGVQAASARVGDRRSARPRRGLRPASRPETALEQNFDRPIDDAEAMKSLEGFDCLEALEGLEEWEGLAGLDDLDGTPGKAG